MALTPEQKSQFVYNKLIGGKSYTNPALELDEEPFSGREGVLFENVWIDLIPTSNPLQSHITYPSSGAVHPATSSIIKKYHKLLLKPVTSATTNQAFYYGTSFKDLIPSEYGDGSYQWEVWKKDVHGNHSVPVPYGKNDWLFDPANGVLTFPNGFPSGISNSNPPAITAYQYIGRKGSANILGGVNSVSNLDGTTIILNGNLKLTIAEKYKTAITWASNLSNSSETKNEYTITHGLNSRRISVDVYEKSGGELIPVEVYWKTTGLNQITLNFSPAVLSTNFSVGIKARY